MWYCWTSWWLFYHWCLCHTNELNTQCMVTLFLSHTRWIRSTHSHVIMIPCAWLRTFHNRWCTIKSIANIASNGKTSTDMQLVIIQIVNISIGDTHRWTTDNYLWNIDETSTKHHITYVDMLAIQYCSIVLLTHISSLHPMHHLMYNLQCMNRVRVCRYVLDLMIVDSVRLQSMMVGYMVHLGE